MTTKKYLTDLKINGIISMAANKYMVKQNYVTDREGNRTNYILSISRKFRGTQDPNAPEDQINIEDVYLVFTVRSKVDSPFEIQDRFEGVKTFIIQNSLEEIAKKEKELDEIFHSDNQKWAKLSR